MTASRLCLFLVIVFALGGCFAYKPPALSVASATITDRTEAGMVLSFDIDARNDNTIELPLANVDYTVWLDGRRVFSGTRSAEASLRRVGTQKLTLPAAIPADFIPDAGPALYRIEGRLTYLIPGRLAEVLFDAGVLRPKVAFGGHGDVDVP